MLEDFPEVRRRSLLKEEATKEKWRVRMVVEDFQAEEVIYRDRGETA